MVGWSGSTGKQWPDEQDVGGQPDKYYRYGEERHVVE